MPAALLLTADQSYGILGRLAISQESSFIGLSKQYYMPYKLELLQQDEE